MYADQVAAGTKRSIRERLNGDLDVSFGRSRQVNGKRQRPSDDKWEHDLYKDDEPRMSNVKIGPKDLRVKLQKKEAQQTHQRGHASSPGGVRDLREKLSGTMHPQHAITDPPKAKPAPEASRPIKKSKPSEASATETKKVAVPVSLKKKVQEKADKNTVNGLLQSLGLEKYQIIFQAEEIDMTALLHMTDEDLKALGVPMGPRKKILLALDSRA